MLLIHHFAFRIAFDLMLPKKISHYCQKCLAGNPLGQEFCARCGTRLMIVVEPRAARYEAEESSVEQEDHLLERVSALEYRLVRVSEKLDQALDLLLRQAQSSYFDHSLMETLIGILGEAGTIDPDNLQALWEERCDRDAAEQEESHRREHLRRKIIAQYRGPEHDAFESHVNEGMSLLEKQEPTKGTRLLERALLLSKNSLPLLSLLGEEYFRSGRTARARHYLTRAFAAAPDDVWLCLLLGLACGDEGEAARARALLEQAARGGCSCFAVHYALGRLLAAEERWVEALAEFKLALAVWPSPEAHYVVGSVYYLLGRDRMAQRHLRKAVEMDQEYAAANFVLGLAYLRAGEAARARQAFEAARVAGLDGALYRSAARRPLRSENAPAVPPLWAAAREAKKRLLTGGDERLAEALRENALGAALSTYEPEEE